MNNKVLISALTATIMLAAPAGAEDTVAGEKIFKKVCRTCHGPKAQGMASFPKLAGLDAEYLATRLEAYRAGESFGPNTPLMAPHAKKLSDEEITSIATYIATSFE